MSEQNSTPPTPSTTPVQASPSVWRAGSPLTISVGVGLVMMCIAQLSYWTHHVELIAAFAASTLLILSNPKSPLVRPQNIIGGHLIAASVGLLVLHTFGAAAIWVGIAEMLAIYFMYLSKTLHPPAAATTLGVFLVKPSWLFVLNPVLSGAVLLVLLAKPISLYLAEHPYRLRG